MGIVIPGGDGRVDIHELKTELDTCDQQFPVYIHTTDGLAEVAEITPVLIGTEFAYLITADTTPEAVLTEDMDDWLSKRGHDR